MSVFTALLVGFLAGFAYFARRFMGDFYLERPIILGPLVGIVMGDITTGLYVGATLELIFMGAVDIGGSVAPNVAIGAAIGTAFAIHNGWDVAQALGVAIPAALLGSFFEMFAKTFSTFFASACERCAEKGDTAGISMWLHLGNLAHFLAYAAPTFFACYLGVEAVGAMMEGVPESLRLGITVAGKVLPALGFALLLNTQSTKKFMPLFFIGFMLAAYLNFGVLGTAILAILVAMIVQNLKPEEDDDFVEDPGEARESLLSPADVKQLYWRSFAIQSAFSFDRMQAIGFTWSLIPILKREYKEDKEGLTEALKRHLVFFNTFPWINGPIHVLAAEMEIKKARGEDIDVKAIQGVKSALMGPIAGIGDSLIHGTFRPVLGGVCAGLALSGAVAAPFIFLFATIALHTFLRWLTINQSVKFGERALGVVASSSFKKLIEGATMTGLMATGALVGTWLNVQTGITYTTGEAVIALQTMLNGVFPKIIPLGITMLSYFLIKKGLKTNTIMLILVVASMILGAFKILV